MTKEEALKSGKNWAWTINKKDWHATNIRSAISTFATQIIQLKLTATLREVWPNVSK